MPPRSALLAPLLLLLGTGASADITIPLQGIVPSGPETHFFLPFEVPEGIVEIEIQHDDLSTANILDWGLDDPDGFRGWGGGKSEAAVVGVDAASPSYLPGPIPAGTWEVVVGKALIVEEPARYDVLVTLRTQPTLPPQPEREPYRPAPPLETGARWYAGDIHMHTVESDGTPEIEELLDFAQSRGMDFVMLSEHNTTSQLSFYVDAQRKYPNMLLIPGVELTTYAGHANLIGVTEWVDHRTGVRGSNIRDSFTHTHDQGALVSINHPDLNIGNACIGCGWMHDVDPLAVDAVEVINGFFPGATFWEGLLARGSHAAAMGGSDDHFGGQGSGALYSPVAIPTTRVYAEELSVAAILRAIRSGRTMIQARSPLGPMIETDLSGPRVRDTVFADQATLRATVAGGVGTTLQTIRNGVVVDAQPVMSDPFSTQITVAAPASGEDRYRHQLTSAATDAIGSHVWLRAPRRTVGCTPEPLAICQRPAPAERSVLDLGRKRGGKEDRLVFRWSGSSDGPGFGDPENEDGYALCLYDDTTRALIHEARVPAGGDCGKQPCWSGAASGNRFAYRDGTAREDGILKIVLRSSGGAAKALVVGRGDRLDLPPLPLPLPLRTQLQAQYGGCWETTHATARVNDGLRLKAQGN